MVILQKVVLFVLISIIKRKHYLKNAVCPLFDLKQETGLY